MSKKTFKCTGICASCGRCKNSDLVNEANDRKTKMLEFPADFEADKGNSGYGIAFDIGTTTVVGMLWNLETGEMLGAQACTNPQNEFGLDVISRITFCGEEEGNLELIRSKIVEGLNSLIKKLSEAHGITGNDIVRAAASGNTTMAHLFTGHDPKTLALSPFTPAYEGKFEMSGKEAGLDIKEDGIVTVLPNIAGHVGGDITAGIVATRLLSKEKLTLFIDIGTNGEIVLADSTRALTCSTAAGPAFEGAAIYQGMRAAAGAIERIVISDEDVDFRVIESCAPVGICGSGLIDAVAQMIEKGIINKTGRIESSEDYAKKQPESTLGERIREGEAGREFVLVYKENAEDIVITQKDIREVQLAKGAIASGITILISEAGKTLEDIDRVLVAGAFGSFINKESAVSIGLLPVSDLDRIISVGNTAGAGVSMALACSAEMKAAEEVPERVEHIELASCKNFQEIYLMAMGFRKV